MKYEYLKGSEKDFEGAPEWAAHVVKLNRDSSVAWVSGRDNKYQYKYDPDEQYGHPIQGSFISWDWRDGVEIIAERRPITEPELKPIYGDGIHDDSEALQQRIDMGIDINNIIGEQGKLFNISRPLQFKPITEPAWSGEGLPPVGVECEILWNDDWVKSVVKAYGEEQIIFKAEGSREWAGHINNYKFRPIRSPEDVARDEAIEDIANVINPSSQSAKDILAPAIYDAIAAGKIKGVKLEGK